MRLQCFYTLCLLRGEHDFFAPSPLRALNNHHTSTLRQPLSIVGPDWDLLFWDTLYHFLLLEGWVLGVLRLDLGSFCLGKVFRNREGHGWLNQVGGLAAVRRFCVLCLSHGL